MKQKLLSLIFVLTCLIGVSFAQSRQVSGRVTSAKEGSPVGGVSVAVVGTSTATQTNENGDYTIEVPNAGASLIFSYVGFLSQRINVNGQTVIDIQLESDETELDEVVVVAYGTARKSEVTGSIATIGSDDLEKRTVTNISNALAGMAPGISVSSGNGQPGSGANVRLRGIGSMNASSEPLYVVDGAPFDGNIGDIMGADIESISILKDATSAALYGSRAGNGVIMITTKKGRGTPKLNVSLQQGISQRGIQEYETIGTFDYYPTVFQALKHSEMFSGDRLSGEEASQAALAAIKNELAYNPFDVPDDQILDIKGRMNPNAGLKYDDFDWFDAIQRTGKRTDANLNVAGSADNSDYYVSLGYLNDQGYVLNSDFQRFNGRVNVNSQIKDWLRTGVNISGSTSTGTLAVDASTGNGNSYVNPFNFIRGLGSIYPVHAYDHTTGAPIVDEVTGTHYYDYGMHPGAINRPGGASAGRHVVYETMLNDRINKRTMLGGRAFAEVKFLKDFTFTPSISLDITNRNWDYTYNPIVGDGVSYNGLVYGLNDVTRSYTFNQVLSYRKSLDGVHNISALAGHENYDYQFNRKTATKTGQVTGGITEFDNYVTPFSTTGYKNVNRIESWFAKGSYNYDEKYFFDGSVRRDGSSIFSRSKRWGTFFSIGGAWAISKEDFMQDVSWVNDLRLKSSYGQVGNNHLLDANNNRIYFGYQALYELGYNNGTLPGTILYSLANPNLTWETSSTFNLGLDFSLFSNRLRGELEFYRRGSDQLLMTVPLPLSAAVSSQFRNVGAMYNRGFEISLTGDLIRKQNFTWTLTKNLTTFKNEITKMPAETPVITSGTKRREVGRDYYSFWLRQYAGVDPSDGSSLYIPAEGTASEHIRSVDGVDYVVNQNYARFGYAGTSIPDLVGSIMNTFNYKGIGMSFLLNYQIGGKMYDSQYAGLMSTNSFGKSYHIDALKAWTTDNTTSGIPRLDQSNSANINAASDRWLIDASYFSIRNVNVSYNLPSNWLNAIDMSSARVFLTGENLALFTKRRGMNPTEGFDGTNNTTYLPTRIFSVGINASF
ncbi:SusC/RagA family TonB-linked outer membrane protein [Sphingobacterium haloxyli]|uniref:SusC/RagA family TonB-linked outer membrane protein n=1 Tax=Sphingobacterium haloxyli TaxID=2100533 RepID=A0A2S9J0X3_9SPHI|nr:TonB-dependent receptor [Sphingobacterium haloxyli]PRD46435.1 SusC/RagA family TonB-linked outer membrane protein [Sphingobacterium haloxyli]